MEKCISPPAHKKTDNGQPSGQHNKMLLALAEPNAYGTLCEASGPAKVRICCHRKGISVCVLTASPDTAADLENAGLAEWQPAGKSGVRRLVLSPTGRARSARLQADGEMSPFQAQHQEISRKTMDSANTTIAFDESESPLAWLARRKGRDGRALIDPVCLAAGERFRADLTIAQMLPRVTANWSATGGRAKGGGAGMVFTDMLLAARQRVRKALDAAGPELSGVLIDVCGFLKGLETVESEHAWPQRTAKVVLDLGLRQLARHYGMAVSAIGPDRNRSLGHWGAPDYRPHIGQYNNPEMV